MEAMVLNLGLVFVNFKLLFISVRQDVINVLIMYANVLLNTIIVWNLKLVYLVITTVKHVQFLNQALSKYNVIPVNQVLVGL